MHKFQLDDDLPMLDALLSGDKLWDVRADLKTRLQKIRETHDTAKLEHEYMLEHEPQDEFHACVILGALILLSGLLKEDKVKKINVVKHQHYACRYRGDNGDLIVGRVISGRRGGDIQLINLLTGSKAFKSHEVLAQRNKRVTKRQADQIVKIWEKTKNKATARAAAVATKEFFGEERRPTDKTDKPQAAPKRAPSLANPSQGSVQTSLPLDEARYYNLILRLTEAVENLTEAIKSKKK